jgi:hypothetical protein
LIADMLANGDSGSMLMLRLVRCSMIEASVNRGFLPTARGIVRFDLLSVHDRFVSLQRYAEIVTYG